MLTDPTPIAATGLAPAAFGPGVCVAGLPRSSKGRPGVLPATFAVDGRTYYCVSLGYERLPDGRERVTAGLQALVPLADWPGPTGPTWADVRNVPGYAYGQGVTAIGPEGRLWVVGPPSDRLVVLIGEFPAGGFNGIEAFKRPAAAKEAA